MQFIMKNSFSNVKLFFQWVIKKNNSDFLDGSSRLPPWCSPHSNMSHFLNSLIGMIVAVKNIQSTQSSLGLCAATTKFHYRITRNRLFEI